MTATIRIANGTLGGVQSGNVIHYRNIPYAQAARFETPQPSAAWEGVRDASRHGPVCPQLMSPITGVMGRPSAAEQNEACLTLSVSTPATPAAPRPVMVWLHGGAYIVGAGSYEWYRADALVEAGDVIVVTLNYRIGVFGYLHMPGVSTANLGMLDQLAALRWVRDNIAAFGGDPQQVTVFGESAGGHSIIALMASDAAGDLFRRAIVQSPHLGVGFTSQSRAARVAKSLTRWLDGRDPRTATPEELLAAQVKMQMELAGPGGLNSVPPYGPIAGLAPLEHVSDVDPCRAQLHADVDLLIGCTSEEMRAYFDLNPRIVALRQLPRVGARAYNGLVRALTERIFARPVERIADARAKAGTTKVFVYRFEWAPNDAPHGSCHAIDLPFTFGSEAWKDAPMLGSTPWDEVLALGRQLRTAWTSFAKTGDPNAAGTPTWKPHVAGAGPARRFFRG